MISLRDSVVRHREAVATVLVGLPTVFGSLVYFTRNVALKQDIEKMELKMDDKLEKMEVRMDDKLEKMEVRMDNKLENLVGKIDEVCIAFKEVRGMLFDKVYDHQGRLTALVSIVFYFCAFNFSVGNLAQKMALDNVVIIIFYYVYFISWIRNFPP